MTTVAYWHDAVDALEGMGLVLDRGDADDEHDPVVDVPDWAAAATAALALGPEPRTYKRLRAVLMELASDPELARAVEAAYALAGVGWSSAVLAGGGLV